MSMVVGGLKKKNGQSLVCFMWLRVEEKKKRAEFNGVYGSCCRAFPVLFVTNAVKVQLTQIFLSSRSGMLTTTRTKKIKYNTSSRLLHAGLGTSSILGEAREKKG